MTFHRTVLRSWLLVVLPLAVTATGSIAQEAATASTARIAVVDLDRVFLLSPLGKQLQEELRALQQETRERLEQQATELQQLSQEAQGKPLDEQRAITRQQEDLQLAIRRTRNDAERRATKLEADRRSEIEEQLQPIFAQVQEERGYDLILNKTPGVVIFVEDSFEITELILERLTGAGAGGE